MIPADTEILLDALDKKLLGAALRDVYRRDRGIPAIFLLCTHEWSNIGDLAINYSETALLERLFPTHEVFPISRSTLAADWQRLRRTITPDDLVVIHGGGNLGDIWPHEEAARLAVVEGFSRNRIISMPQSIHFDDPALAHRSMAVYRRHPHLLLAVRDDRSLEIAREHLDAERVVRAEDTASRQEYPFGYLPHENRVLFVSRDDREKRPGSGMERLHGELVAGGVRVETTDTMAPPLPFSGTELAAKLVYRKIDELRASDVVVTDRLHGALFALIAGRPVVVYENSYGKIAGALKNLAPTLGARLRFAEEAEGPLTPELIEELSALPASTLRPAEILADSHHAFDARLVAESGLEPVTAGE